MHLRLGSGRELPASSANARAARAGPQLGEHLVVGVAAADARAKLGERRLVDPGDRRPPAGPGHARSLELLHGMQVTPSRRPPAPAESLRGTQGGRAEDRLRRTRPRSPRASSGRIRSSAPTQRAQNCEPACRRNSSSASSERPRSAVDARRQHRVESVRDVDDAGPSGISSPPQAVGVAGAVEALVVVPDRRNRIVEEPKAIDDASAFVGVPLHQRPLLLGQARGLPGGSSPGSRACRCRGRAPRARAGRARPATARVPGRSPARAAGRGGVAAVYASRASTVAEALHRRRRALLEQPVRLLERDVLRVDGLDGLAETSEPSAACVSEVRLLRLAHEQQRHREDGDRVEAGGVVADRDHAADEPVDDVVRGQPREPLLPHAPPLPALDREARATGDRC